MKALDLVCGDPEGATDGASYSRFVIPFAYRKGAFDNANEGARSSQTFDALYEYVAEPDSGSKGSDDKWRREYLTNEIESVLFEKAKWYRLQPLKGKKGETSAFRRAFTIKVNGKEIAACLSAPLLVLFECPSENSSCESENSWDTLQVGFLVVEIFFSDSQKEAVMLDDLLKINELFRYFSSPFEDHFNERNLRDFIALDSFGFPTSSRGEVHHDPKSFYDRWWHLITDFPIQGTHWKIECARYEKTPEEVEKVGAEDTKEYAKNVYPDNRAFVWTCAILPLGAEHLWQTLTKDYWKASHHGHWIKLLNVDYPSGKTSDDVRRSTSFERGWAEKHTYHRWEELGTYYGFTPHSGAALAPRSSNPPTWKHFRQMYFDQVLLLLYLRVVLFRFSAKLGNISREARSPDRAREIWAKEFQKLRWQFTLFTNLYQFPLLSNQQQGVELYSLARQCMEVDDLFEEVQEQIHNSHDYLAQELERRQTRETVFLTRVATIISVILFTVALFSMRFFEQSPWVHAWATKLGHFMTFFI